MLLNKHLTYENRKSIENSLNNNLNFSQIDLLINKPYKTISNEVKKNKISEYGGSIAWCSQSPCDKINKPPYVYNGCSKRRKKNIITMPMMQKLVIKIGKVIPKKE